MPTLLTHPAIPLALGLGLGGKTIPRRLLVAGMVASMLPDLDVLAFRFGFAYASAFGHRGFSHSLLFAASMALLGACAWRWWRVSFGLAGCFLFISMASHGVLDAFTNGGFGVAFFWPLTHQRFFFGAQVIEVSPLSVSRFLSERGAAVLASELLWVWLPCLALAGGFAAIRLRLTSYARPQSGRRAVVLQDETKVLSARQADRTDRTNG
jgi:inner membrane protein